MGGGTLSYGLLIDGGSSNITVRNNTLRANTGVADGAGLRIENSGATVSGNTIGSNAPNVQNTASLLNAAIGAGSTGNVAAGGTCDNGGGNSGTLGFTNAGNCP